MTDAVSEELARVVEEADTVVHLNYRQLEEVPRALLDSDRFQVVRRVRLKQNKLTTLPEDINKLTNLVELYAAANSISSLPDNIGALNNLESLDLSGNRLTSLPVAIGRLMNLEHLQLSNNQLQTLPKDIGAMKSLRSVYVDNNPYLHAIPLSIYSQEIGFSSSGVVNYDTSQGDTFEVRVNHTTSETKTIVLPRGLHVIGDRDSLKTRVPSLLELSLRATYMTTGSVAPPHLPQELRQLLCTPVATCACCHTPVFTMGFPMVFEGQVRVYDLYRLALCCSARCVRVASLCVNLPLIYPDCRGLNMALALPDQ